MFFWVSESSKAYKLYNPMTKILVISRDVVFNEESKWNWTDGNSVPNPILDGDDVLDGEKEEVPEIQELPSSQFEIQELPSSQFEIQEQPLSPLVVQQSEEEKAYNLRGENTTKRPAWMMDYDICYSSTEDDHAHFALFVDSDPIIYEEAVKEKKWREAMDKEIETIEKNHTWELTNLPKGQKTIGVRWVFRTKLNEKGEIDKHKARLVAKGYKQKHGIDYKEIFAPVTRHDTIRLVISLAASNSGPIFN